MSTQQELLTTTHQIDTGYLNMLNEVAERPLGASALVSLSAQGLLRHIEQDSTLLDVVEKAQIMRGDTGSPLTSAHAAGMTVMHLPNHMMMWREGNLNYPHDPTLALDTEAGWQALHAHIQKKYLRLYRECLATKDVQTTEVNRGVDYPMIVQRVFGKEAIRVVDLGCSANWVWAQLTLGQNGNYHAIDHTPGELVMRHAADRVHIAQQIGIDHTDPLRDDESIRWFLANRHLRDVTPDAIAKAKETIERNKTIPEVQFRRGDINDPPLPNHEVDLVSASTVLYQLSKEGRTRLVEETIPRLLSPKGIAVIKDYCIVDKAGNLVFVPDRGPYSYRTMVMGSITGGRYLELIRARTSMCEELIAGENYEEFVTITQKE